MMVKNNSVGQYFNMMNATILTQLMNIHPENHERTRSLYYPSQIQKSSSKFTQAKGNTIPHNCRVNYCADVNYTGNTRAKM
jgi:hypothetical protein